eukprot:358439-Chlamydomonas_euryale.AAC.10
MHGTWHMGLGSLEPSMSRDMGVRTMNEFSPRIGSRAAVAASAAAAAAAVHDSTALRAWNRCGTRGCGCAHHAFWPRATTTP